LTLFKKSLNYSCSFRYFKPQEEMMENEVKGMAKHFVMLLSARVDKKEDEGCIFQKIGEAGVQALQDLLAMAGFEVSAVVPGVIEIPEYDQGGSYTGEVFSVNPFCRYKALDPNGKDHVAATGWLNDLAEKAWQIKLANLEGVAADRWVEAEILRSQPLEPIHLCGDDFLLEVPPTSHVGIYPDYMPDHRRNSDPIPQLCAGIHRGCTGIIDRVVPHENRQALRCRKCQLTIKVAVNVASYGDLRQALALTCGSGTD
jgi:hypothetical protein